MYKTSSLALFKIAGIEVAEFTSSTEEMHCVSRSIRAMENKAYFDGWHITEELTQCLLNVLRDNKDNYNKYSISRRLVLCKQISAEIIECLEPWNQLVFKWKEASLTSASISDMLSVLGIHLSADSLMKIDGWLANPASSIDHPEGILSCLFGEKLHVGFLRDDCDFSDNDYANFFAKLASKCHPTLEVENIRQSRDVDQWIIDCKCNGIDMAFPLESLGSWFNTEGVLQIFNRMMRETGNRLSAFSLSPSTSSGFGIGYFIVADDELFPTIAKQLHLPLETHGMATTNNPAN